jgi:starvation-inducible DNA-binding protein
MPNLAACGAADALGLDGGRAREEVAAGLNRLLAEAFVLYLKDQETSTGICRDRTPATITPLLDEQSDQIFAITDPLAEGVRKLGGTTLRSTAISRGCSASSTTTPSS